MWIWRILIVPIIIVLFCIIIIIIDAVIVIDASVSTMQTILPLFQDCMDQRDINRTKVFVVIVIVRIIEVACSDFFFRQPIEKLQR